MAEADRNTGDRAAGRKALQDAIGVRANQGRRPKSDVPSAGEKGVAGDAETSVRTGPGIFVSLSPMSVAIVCALVLFARKSDSFLNPQFFAEDASVYFMDARTEGARSLFKPFLGSLYVFQRAIAYIGNWVPVRFAPHFYNGVAFVITLAVAVYIARARIDVNNKWLMALAVVIIPHYGEVFMTLTNSHWILGLGLIVFIVSRDAETTLQRIIEPLMVLVTCLSGPFVLLFLPLFLIRAVVRRTAFSGLIALIACICFCLQWMITNPPDAPGVNRFTEGVNFRDPHWLGFWGDCLAGMLLLGQPITHSIPNNPYLVALSVLFYGLLITYALLNRDRMCAVFLWAAGSILAAVAYSYRGDPSQMSQFLAFRYSYIPYVCTAWILIIMLEKTPRLRPVAAFTLFLIVLSTASVFVSAPMTDLNWQEASRGIGGPVPCIVPINPTEGYNIHYVPK